MDKNNSEVWKDVQGFKGYYQVSNEGNVRSVDRTNKDGRKYKGRQLSLRTDHRGYKDVMLYKEGIAKRVKVHRLVAEAFIPNPNNLPQVNHLNEVKDDNNVSNLEWITDIDNKNYGSLPSRRRLRGIEQGVKVVATDSNGNKRVFNSIKEASVTLGVYRSAIYQSLSDPNIFRYGFKFKKVMG